MPEGFLRTDRRTGDTLAVLHTFADTTPVALPLPHPLAVTASLHGGERPHVTGTILHWAPPAPFTAVAVLLEGTP